MEDRRGEDVQDTSVDADVLPEGAPRGGITVPTTNDTGITTPPIAGWGETLPRGESDEAEDE